MRILIGFIAAFFQSIAVSKVTMTQIQNPNRRKQKVFFIIMYLYCLSSFFIIPNQLRFILFIIVIALTLYYTERDKGSIILLYSFMTEIIMAISEIIITSIFVFLKVKPDLIVNDYFLNFIVIALISILGICLSCVPFVKKIIMRLGIQFRKNEKLIKYLFLFFIIIYLVVSKNGLELIFKQNYYINVLFLISVAALFVIMMENEKKYEKITEENKLMYNYVTKYEDIITQQGKANHEFKNQLMVIRGYAQMQSEKLIEYIDSVVEDSKKTYSSQKISQLNKFPDGGIKGLLYYKLSTMEEQKIKYELDVEVGVKTKLKDLSVSNYKNITKILGVLLDNAIDASKKSKNKKIIISVVNEKTTIKFIISNTYKGKIDISKLGTGYSSKGKGHGYGLKLVDDIIRESNKFIIESSCDKDYFSTKLTIKLRSKK